MFLSCVLILFVGYITSSYHSSMPGLRYKIEDPLIVMLGIGEYDHEHNLIGMANDYFSVIYTFHKEFEYSIFYQNKKNQNEYHASKTDLDYNKASEALARNKESRQGKKYMEQLFKNVDESVKTRWKYDEIVSFFEESRKMLISNNHDALIFVISSHGDS